MTNKEKIYNILSSQPREKWIELIKPLIEEVSEENGCCYVDVEQESREDPYCSFTLEVLKPNYQFKLNIGDKVMIDNILYEVYKLPILDSRVKGMFTSCEICQRGSSYTLRKVGDEFPSDLYYEDTNFMKIENKVMY